MSALVMFARAGWAGGRPGCADSASPARRAAGKRIARGSTFGAGVGAGTAGSGAVCATSRAGFAKALGSITSSGSARRRVVRGVARARRRRRRALVQETGLLARWKHALHPAQRELARIRALEEA